MLTLLRDGEAIATQPNASGALTSTLDALLMAGLYQVRVEGANGTSGSVILLVQSETPALITDIGLDTLVSETLDSQVPVASSVAPTVSGACGSRRKSPGAGTYAASVGMTSCCSSWALAARNSFAKTPCPAATPGCQPAATTASYRA